MALATFSVRMEEGLKKQFDDLCDEFGMNTTTAFNIFAKAVVRERRIPFAIQAKSTSGEKAFTALRAEARQNGIQDMSPDDINAEITRSRQQRVAE